jgi:hypothetical protein
MARKRIVKMYVLGNTFRSLAVVPQLPRSGQSDMVKRKADLAKMVKFAKMM